MSVHMLMFAQESGDGGLGLFLPLLLFGAAIWFMVIRPQRQRVKRQQELASNIEIGDQVRTYGGLFGVVLSIDGEAVVLGIEEGRVRVAKQAIGGVVNADGDS